MAHPKPTRMPPIASIGNPAELPLLCGPRNQPAVAVARRMASSTSVAVIVPCTVIKPELHVLTGPSEIGGTYVPWPEPGAGHTVVERCVVAGAPPAARASLNHLSVRYGLPTIDLLRSRAARWGPPLRTAGTRRTISK